MKTLQSTSFLLFLLLLGACNLNNNIQKLLQSSRFVNPAFEGFDVPFQEFTFNAEEGDTIFCSSGSILLFPANSLVDEKGNIVKGSVSVSYREFADPLDFFIAGIPMKYDSAGITYDFESSAMCEIHAFKNKVPLFINPKIKPEINLITQNTNTSHSLYYLDTVSRQWVNKGQDTIIDLSGELPRRHRTGNSLPILPLKPVKPNGISPTFSVKIEPGSVPELQVYDKLKFEVEKDEKSFNPNDAKEEWSDIKIVNSKKAGVYQVSFINASRQVTILAHPVFEGVAYHEAVKVFREKEAEYKRLREERLAAEKNALANNETNSKNNALGQERIRKLNELVEARNKATRARNIEIDERNKNVIAQNQKIEEPKLNGEIFRVFAIELFGFWNWDFPRRQVGQPLLAVFKDKSGKELSLEKITVVYKDLNGIFEFKDQNIIVFPNSDNMIWAVSDNKFVYLNSDEFRKCKIDSTTKEYSFTMNIHPKNITSREELVKIIRNNS